MGKPRYLEIKEWIKEQIDSTQLTTGDRVYSEKELSDRFNVSRITSKRALEELVKDDYIVRKQGHGNFVKEKRKKDSKIIAMVFPYGEINALWSEYIKGANEVAMKSGYFITPYFPSGNTLETKLFLQKLTKSPLAGIIYYPKDSIRNADLIHSLVEENYPIVTIDKYFDRVEVDSVTSDNRRGGELWGKYHREKNHKNIAMVFGRDIWASSSVRDRYLAVNEVLREDNIKISKVITNYLNSDKNLIGKLLIEKQVDGIMCEHDFIALELAKFYKNLGVKIDIIGFDNLKRYFPMDIEFDTISQDFLGIGKKACELLVDRIENRGKKRRNYSVDIELIEGE